MHLLSMMRINTEAESTVIVHIPKKLEDITIQALYSEKLTSNPELKLSNFL